MTTPAYQQALEYQRTQVETASPAQLVGMLYDGAIRFLSLARECMSDGSVEVRHTNLVKAQRVIAELLASLDHRQGGSIAANLRNLYAYMLQQLVEANLYDDVHRMDTVVELLRELRDGWTAVERVNHALIGAPGSQPPKHVSEPGVRRVAVGG